MCKCSKCSHFFRVIRSLKSCFLGLFSIIYCFCNKLARIYASSRLFDILLDSSQVVSEDKKPRIYITKYGSTLYIGMDEVLAHLPVHSKILICTFTFSNNPLLTPQGDSQDQYVCVPKIWLELDY